MSFKVQVAVRFKPGSQIENKLVLPLHQVLKFKKEGQKLSSNFKKDYGISSSHLGNHLSKGHDIPPEVMQTLIEAEQLNILYQSSKPKIKKKLVWNDETNQLDEVFVEVYENNGAENTDVNAENHLQMDKPVDLKMLNERTVEKSDKENVDASIEGANSNPQSQNYQFYNNSAKILSVLKSKVSMFIPGAGVKHYHFSNI